MSSSINELLRGYIAQEVSAEQVVAAVAAEYYGEGGRGKREGLKALMEIIERAHPGIIELSASTQRPGFGVRLAERPFPKRYEGELRQAVQAILVGGGHVEPLPASPVPLPGLFTRVIRAIRRVFSASA